MLGRAAQARQARKVVARKVVVGEAVGPALKAKGGGVFRICLLQPRPSLHGV